MIDFDLWKETRETVKVYYENLRYQFQANMNCESFQVPSS